MNKLRQALTAVLVTGSAAVVVAAGAGPAAAAVPTHSKFLAIGSAGTMLVDQVHKRVLISDKQNGRLVVTDYNGSVYRLLIDRPGLEGLALSADSSTLYAAVAGENSIVGFDTATMTQTKQYTLPGIARPETLVRIGQTLYFGYSGNPEVTSGGNFGSLDLTTGTAKGGLHKGSIHDAPQLLTVPGAPSRLVLVDRSSNAATGGNMFVYDVSGGTPALKASDTTGAGFVRHAALSNDGSTITAVGSPCRTFVAPVADPHQRTDAYEQLCAGTTVDVDPDDDRVAIGYGGTLSVYPAGSPTAEQSYTLPAVRTGDAPDLLDAVVSEPGGPRLFAVSHNARSEFHMWVLNQPPKTVPVVTLTAPATAPYGSPVKISGTITAVPAGTTLFVHREGPASSQGLPQAVVDAEGKFTITDTVKAGGTTIYTFSFMETSKLAAVQGTVTVAIGKAPVTLTAAPASATVAYAKSTGVNVKVSGGVVPDEVVEIWSDPYGADLPPKLIYRGKVAADRNVGTTIAPTRNVGLTFNYLGTAATEPASARSFVYTKVAAATTTSRQYKTANIGSVSYIHFRNTVNPYFTTTMTAYPGRKARLQFEVHSGGAWKPWKTVDTSLNASGKSYYTLTGTHSTGVSYRVRPAYLTGTSGDSVNYTTYGAYRYFTFTK